MAELFDDMFDDAEALVDVNTDTGRTLSNLVRKLRNVEREIDDAEEHLKSLKQEKHKLSTETIPQLMAEMQIDRLDVDGVTVSCKLAVHASIPADRREEAFQWLRDNHLDDIIKNDVIVSFGRGEDNIAGDVVASLQDRGLHPETKTHIHSSTLKAFVKERFENGKPIDLDMFGAFILNTATIKRK